MERKVAFGTMLTLILVSMLAFTTTIHLAKAAAWNPADVNNDNKVDGKDITAVSLCFGAHEGGPRWSAPADVNGDGKIDGRDIWQVARNFGQVAPPP